MGKAKISINDNVTHLNVRPKGLELSNLNHVVNIKPLQYLPAIISPTTTASEKPPTTTFFLAKAFQTAFFGACSNPRKRNFSRLSNALSQSSTLPRALCNIKTWTATRTITQTPYKQTPRPRRPTTNLGVSTTTTR